MTGRVDEIATSLRSSRNQAVAQSRSYTKNSLKVEDTVHLSSVFWLFIPNIPVKYQHKWG